ncbi:proto-oncogene tyrosine-protein kinase LCK-like isoform X2 [Convolutriloba macropyga]|uniref:proto-oncogene tyrosine-protein kinase LCK-like isoform X2 n=1 Tax=Convolutriloba macropyga TaxID=536237 RepID=UPI003F527FB1
MGLCCSRGFLRQFRSASQNEMNSAPPLDSKHPPIDIKEHQQVPEPSLVATMKPDEPVLQHSAELRAIFTFHAENSAAGNNNEIDLVRHRIYQLIDSTWFFEDMDRAKAVEILQLSMHGKGNYIIRNSSGRSNCFALSLRCVDDNPYERGAIKHYIINIDSQGQYFLNEKNRFKSMDDFLRHYADHSGGMEVSLRAPCAKEKPLIPNRIKRDMAGLSQISPELLQWVEKLGKGNFGEVWKCKMKCRDVAVKTLTSENAVSRQEFLREAENMNKYRHPNLVEFVCVSYNERDNKLYLVSELMNGGDLHAYLSKRRRNNVRFHINYMLKIALQILDGMIYLEAHNVVHRDLRAQNVLVGNEETFKISDFGLLIDQEHKDVHSKFPIRWTAPEAIRDSTKFSTKSDVWSFGILMIEIVSMGVNPYPDMHNHKDVQRFVTQGHVHPMPDECPVSLYDVITLCWRLEPEKRPNFEGLKHTLEDSLLDKDGQYNE